MLMNPESEYLSRDGINSITLMLLSMIGEQVNSLTTKSSKDSIPWTSKIELYVKMFLGTMCLLI